MPSPRFNKRFFSKISFCIFSLLQSTSILEAGELTTSVQPSFINPPAFNYGTPDGASILPDSILQEAPYSPEITKKYLGSRRESRRSVQSTTDLGTFFIEEKSPKLIKKRRSFSKERTSASYKIGEIEVPSKIDFDPKDQNKELYLVGTLEPSNKVKILSIDGGGTRGLISACGLEKIEAELNKPANEIFDIFVGTSVGAIIAAAAACGFSGKEIKELLIEHSKDIFSSPFLHKVKTGFGLWGAPYKSDRLESLLKERFGDRKLRDVEANLVITTYNTEENQLQTFSSYEIKDDTENADISLVECILASTAAPTKFPPVNIKGQTFIDGGVTANNPTLLGIAEAVKGYKKGNASLNLQNELLVASLGTGEVNRPLKPKTNWGVLSWATKIVDVLIRGNSDCSENIAEDLAQNVYRLQPILKRRVSLDDFSSSSQKFLIENAAKYFDKNTNLSFNKMINDLKVTNEDIFFKKSR